MGWGKFCCWYMVSEKRRAERFHPCYYDRSQEIFSTLFSADEEVAGVPLPSMPIWDKLARIEYRIEDYLDHSKASYYDGILVIGMMEHVGLGGYRDFFSRLYTFLKTGGTAVVHTIISPTSAEPTNRWIDRHIFTGGY